MEELDFGPNGALLTALEEFYNNIEELELNNLISDYLIIDCPGQIELFIHSETMKGIVTYFEKYFKCCIVYLIESQYVLDVGKYLGGCLSALLCMMRFNLPCLNVISKADLLPVENDAFLLPDERLNEYLESKTGNEKMFCEKTLELILENNLLSFTLLNWEDENLIEDILYNIDSALQYFDDAEAKERIK